MADLIQGDKTSRNFKIMKNEGLDFWVAGAALNRQNETIKIPSGTLTLAPNAVNYVFIDWTSGNIQANQTGFPSRSSQLYKVTTDAVGVISVDDLRSIVRVSGHTEFQTQTSLLLNAVLNASQDWTKINLAGSAPRGATGVLLSINIMDSGTPGSAVWFRVQKPGETELVRAVTIYPQVSGMYINAFAPMGMVNNKIECKAQVSGAMTIKVALMGWIFGG